MTQSRVRFVLGYPVIDDSLRLNTWHYIWTMELGTGAYYTRQLVVYFQQGRLSHFEGDYAPTTNHQQNSEQSTGAD